jgi:YD repeat-containing protein
MALFRRIRDPLSQVTTYGSDSRNNLVSVLDPLSHLTSYSFNYNGQKSSETDAEYTGPDGSLTYAYDNSGQLTTVSGAHSESFGYDSNGNRNTTGYTVGNGNQITNDAAGNTLTYSGGNLATKTDSSLNVWTYTFVFSIGWRTEPRLSVSSQLTHDSPAALKGCGPFFWQRERNPK